MTGPTKKTLGLITYGVVLYVALMNLQKVLGAAGTALGHIKPLIYGAAVAYLLNLLMVKVEDRWLAGLWKLSPGLGKHKRGISLVLTILLVLLGLTALASFILPEVGRSITTLGPRFPAYAKATMEYLSGLFDRLATNNDLMQTLHQQWQKVLETLAAMVGNVLNSAGVLLMGMAGSIGSGVVNFFLSLVFAIYMLASKDSLCGLGNDLLDACLSAPRAGSIRYVVRKTDRAFNNYISGQLLEAIILGVLCGAGMVVLRLPYPVLIGTIIGATGLIPIFGAYIGTIPAVFLIFIISPFQSLVFLIFLLVLQQIETNFIYPRVVGHSIGLEGFWVMVGLIVGGNIFGLPGMLLGIPVTAVLYALLREFLDQRLEERGKSRTPKEPRPPMKVPIPPKDTPKKPQPPQNP